jgi:hypothetical protein
MPDRWNDPRDDRWRREAHYRQERYGRQERGETDRNADYLSGSREGRSFRDHEHDADWDGAYNRIDDDDPYLAGSPFATGYDRGPAYGERDYSDERAARRVGGYTRTPP